MEDLLDLAAAETPKLEDSSAPDSADAAAAARAPAPTPSLVGRASGARIDTGKLRHRTPDDLASCLGAVAAHFIAGSVRVDVLVVQANKQAASP